MKSVRHWHSSVLSSVHMDRRICREIAIFCP